MKNNSEKLLNLFNRLNECTGEDVGVYGGTAAVYTDIFERIFKTPVNRIFNCDGYWDISTFTDDNTYMLTEYKHDVNLKSGLELRKVVAQCVYYLKQFKDRGETMPKVLFIGDKNECVVIPSKIVLPALDCGSSFSCAASHADSDKVLMENLMANSNIDYAFVYDISADFDIDGLIWSILNIARATNGQALAEINEHNIDRVWTAFKDIVFGNSKKVQPNEQVSIFVHYITDHDDFIIDQRKGNVFTLHGKTYKVTDSKRFRQFCNHFGYVRSVRQKEKLRSTCDRFIEDMNRRQKGEFYTPTIFVDYAHKMIEEQFGADWKEKYVVWDCAWGTGNLTRDYKFKELYCSTLEQAELDIARNVNKDATKFKYDFLNDDFEDLPEGLKQTFIEKKPILFLINPPYGTSAAGICKGNNKAGISDTAVNEMMKNEKLGNCSRNIYIQFLYNILKLKEKNENVKICIFSPLGFLTIRQLKPFRNLFFKNFKFLNGVLIEANVFGGVNADWPISFSIWENGLQTSYNFLFEYFDDKKNTKTIFSINNEEPLIDWVKGKVKKLKTHFGLQLTSPIKYRSNKILLGKIADNALGYCYMKCNNAGKNITDVSLLSSCFAAGAGFSIVKDNFQDVISAFSARLLIQPKFDNHHDEYIKPNVDHEKYNQWLNDCHIFSIFTNQSNQSSLRNVDFMGKTWNVKNEFFFMSHDEMMDLADNYGFDELYNDAKSSDERYVYNVLQDLEISDEAKAVLEKARDIVRKSFKYRADVHNDHPEYHLNAWDAGWYQIKKLCTELPMFKEDIDEFKTLFKVLKEKMRPMVYELGFLRK